jgi:transcriptional regulator with GAF, ATPase, and Fis domain
VDPKDDSRSVRAMTPGLARIAGLSLADHTVQSLLDEVCLLARDAVPGAVEVSMTVVQQDRPRTVATTGARALRLDERQYELNHGPCVDGTAAGQLVHVRDMATDARWPTYTPLALELGIHCSLGLPLPVQRDLVSALNVYAEEPDAYGAESIALAEDLASYAAISLVNMHDIETNQATAASLRSAMESRAVIEQARGMLMAERRCTAEVAFDLMVTLAQATDRSLRELAQHMVDEIG